MAVIDRFPDSSRTLSEITAEAIACALAGRWEEAAEANREALEKLPSDPESHNRLAKALIELGRYQEARETAEAALSLAPSNKIARRHLDRLDQLQSNSTGPRQKRAATAAAADLFISDRATATITDLEKVAGPCVLAAISPGDRLFMSVVDGHVVVHDSDDDYVGVMERHMDTRLRRLIEGGNEYSVTAAKISTGGLAVVVREVSRSPAQANIASFPPALQRVTFDYDLEDPVALDDGDATYLPDADDEETVVDSEAERVRSILRGGMEADLDILDDSIAM